MLINLYLKDIRLLFSDKKGFLGFIAMPLVLTTILSFALTGSFAEAGITEAIPIAMVKEYNTEEELGQYQVLISGYAESEALQGSALPDFEQVFFDVFLNSQHLRKMITVRVMSSEAAQHSLENKEIAAVVYLPKGFIFNQYVNFTMPYRNTMTIRVVGRPGAEYASQIVQSILSTYLDELNRRVINKNVYLEVGSFYMGSETLFSGMRDILEGGEMTMDSGTVVRKGIAGKRQVDSFTYYSIAMMGMFILYAASFAGRELLNEKKNGTLDRARTAGVSTSQIITAKYLTTWTLCALQMTVLLCFGKLVLGVDWSSPGKLAVGVFFSALAVSGVGIFLSAITLATENFQTVNIFQNLLIHLFALLGGSYIPLEVLPPVFGNLKYIALNGVVLDLFIKTFQGAMWLQLSVQYGVLASISLVFTGLGAVILQRKEALNVDGTSKA